MIPRRIVLDTSVLVAAHRSRNGASGLLLRACVAGEFQMVATATLFFEYEAVLSRSEHGVSLAVLSRLLEDLANIIEPARIDYQWKPQLADPNDELVLEAATNGHAEAIVTHNVRDFATVPRQFTIAIMTPGDIMKLRRTHPWQPR